MASLALIIVVVLWWQFRPELLFINKPVNQAPPAGITTIQPVFTGSLRAVAGAGETHGRVNILTSGNNLHLEISNLRSQAASMFTVALAPSESLSQAALLGNLSVGGSEKLAIPSGVAVTSGKTVLLIGNSGRILAAATLEPF